MRLQNYHTKNSPKKAKQLTFQEEFGDIIKRLPSIDPNHKGPKITYDDGISNDELERLRKESNNRVNARKRKEKEYQEMIKARNNRYSISINYDDGNVPDFEKQLTHAFNVKFKRADTLGVRNLIIDNNKIIRASRPNMDKLFFVENIKHEVRLHQQELFDESKEEITEKPQEKTGGRFLLI